MWVIIIRWYGGNDELLSESMYKIEGGDDGGMNYFRRYVVCIVDISG